MRSVHGKMPSRQERMGGKVRGLRSAALPVCHGAPEYVRLRNPQVPRHAAFFDWLRGLWAEEYGVKEVYTTPILLLLHAFCLAFLTADGIDLTCEKSLEYPRNLNRCTLSSVSRRGSHDI